MWFPSTPSSRLLPFKSILRSWYSKTKLYFRNWMFSIKTPKIWMIWPKRKIFKRRSGFSILGLKFFQMSFLCHAHFEVFVLTRSSLTDSDRAHYSFATTSRKTSCRQYGWFLPVPRCCPSQFTGLFQRKGTGCHNLRVESSYWQGL